MMKKFKVFKKKVKSEDEKDGYAIDYSSNIFLMSPENEYLYHVE